MKHPLDLDGEDFLKSYIEFTKNNILNDYVNLRVDAVNRVILLLKNNLEITQKLDSMDKYAEDNRIKFFQLFLDQIYNTENEIGDKDILFNYLANLDQKSVTKKIEILEFIKKDISYFDYEPILEINTEQYLEKNFLYRNVVLSTLISFVVFFSIIFFKQIYRDLINK